MLGEINEVLEQLALKGKRYISPLYIQKRLNGNISVEELTGFLLSPICKNMLIPNFEIQCPEGDSDIIVHELTLIPNEIVICHQCGAEYLPDPKRIWISFDFTDGFKEKVKKKNHQLRRTLSQRQAKKHVMVPA